MSLSFDELWKKLSEGKLAGNTLYYHPCCDVWTSKSSKTKRESHPKHLPFRRILSTLDKSLEDKKQALLVKMVEEGWRIPAVLNARCTLGKAHPVPAQSAFKLFDPFGLTSGSAAGLVRRDIPLARSFLVERNPEGTLPFYQLWVRRKLQLYRQYYHQDLILRPHISTSEKTICR
jgi:hypothetical protein